MTTDVMSHADLLTAAQSAIKYRADGLPAQGQSALIRALGRCVAAGECWEFQGHRSPDGYGTLRHEGRMQRAHRVVYMEVIGPISPDAFVCHRCDNPPCCNPSHLFAGTALDNNRDRHAKGRSAGLLKTSPRAERNRAKTHCDSGHPFTPENTYLRPTSGRSCRTCRRIWDANRKANR